MVRHSKTDQEGRGAVRYLGPMTVRRIQTWLDQAGIERGPIFRRGRGGGHVGGGPMSVVSNRRIVAKRAGASLVKMQTAGGWTSLAMPGHYPRGQLAGRGAVARLRFGEGNQRIEASG